MKRKFPQKRKTLIVDLPRVRMEKQMYEIKWTNRHGLEVKLTHQYDTDVYKLGEVLISEGKEISICPME